MRLIMKTWQPWVLLSFLLFMMTLPGLLRAEALQPKSPGTAPTVTGAPAPAPSVGPRAQAPELFDDVERQLKVAVIDAQKKLGMLESWQIKIFEEEVVPQYRRFIRDYRPMGPGTGLNVEVDFENLQNYLKFYAPKVLPHLISKDRAKGLLAVSGANSATQDFRLLVFLKTDPACAKCTASEPAIRALVKSRVEARGFVPVWVAPEEVGDTKLAGRLLHETLTELSRKKGSPGALVVHWAPVPVDDIDSAHADEKHYFVHSFFNIRDLAKDEGKMDLMDSDSFETSLVRLLTASISELGVKADQTVREQAISKEEILIDISGFSDFAHYNRVKTVLTEQLKGVSSLEERKITRGQISLAVGTSASKEEIAKQVSAIVVEPGGAQAIKLGVR